MEAVRDFIALRDTGRSSDRGAAPVQRSGVDGALAVLQDVGSTAVQSVRQPGRCAVCGSRALFARERRGMCHASTYGHFSGSF